MATQLRPFLTEIANAIRTKKGTSDTINAQNFATEITNLPTGGGDNPLQTLVTGKGADGGTYLCRDYKGDNVDFLADIDFSATTSMYYMFNGCSNITTIPLIGTSSVTKMERMFEYCSKLTSIPQLDTSKVTNMGNMFSYCASITTIPQLDTSKVTNMYFMFNNCSNLTTVPQLDTSSATSMNYMFSNCNKLTTIDITQFNASSNASFAYNCNSLTKFIIRTMDTIPTFGTNMFAGCWHFTGTGDSTYNPDGLKDGRIYVPDDKVDELKAATGWSDYADIIVPLSTLVE